jgi:hypothetical protein
MRKPTRCDRGHVIARLDAVCVRGEGDVDQKEVTMTTLMQRTRSSMVRWFRQITRPHKAPYRRYDPDNSGV